VCEATTIKQGSHQSLFFEELQKLLKKKKGTQKENKIVRGKCPSAV
jgi:hypothetical protein